MKGLSLAWNRDAVFTVRPTYEDPVPGRAAAMSQQVRELGLSADSREASIEQFLRQRPTLEPKTIVVLSLDQPLGIARALEQTRGVPVPAYNRWQFPTGHLVGFEAAIAPEDEATRRQLGAFFETLAELTARAGSSAIFGVAAPASNGVVEPVYRESFARHFERNFPKLAAGLELEDEPVELTFDGRTTEPAKIVRSPAAWRTPSDFESELPELITAPPAPGQNLVIVELGPDGMRVHRARFRRFDCAMDIRTVTGVDPHFIAATGATRETGDTTGLALPASLTAGALLFTD